MVNKDSKRIDLLITLGINALFLIIYVCFFELIQESNDDLAMSYLVEGAYGERLEYLIFENVLWGKFLRVLYGILPQFKWYNITFYAMMFLSFCEITYAFIRVQGRKIGTALSCVMLMVCGYHSYVLFQFSRVSAIATIGGMIMLFFAVEYAKKGSEQKLCIAAGAFLTLWAAMMRFQVFGVCVVLVGGALAIYKLFTLLREKPEDMKKQIVTYLTVFGVVGILSLILYLVDYSYYENKEEWRAYKEYNGLRADLWDTGFPAYDENVALYDSLGISREDFIYYLGWEMDEEVLTIDVLKTIQAEKSARDFSIRGFFETFPKGFVHLTTFVLFVVVSLIAIALNKKHIYFVAYEFCGVMALEALFYWMKRYDVDRIDSGMWMAATITIMFAMSKDLSKLTEVTWKWIVAVIGISAIINLSYLDGYHHIQEGKVGSTKAFYQEVIDDKEHLYVMLVTAPSVYYAYDFWEPSSFGALTNVYNSFGWEYNLEVKHRMLESYGIKNIYRDSINNDIIYFVTAEKAMDLQNYIQRNYNEKAYLYFEKEIQGYFVWSIRVDE